MVGEGGRGKGDRGRGRDGEGEGGRGRGVGAGVEVPGHCECAAGLCVGAWRVGVCGRVWGLGFRDACDSPVKRAPEPPMVQLRPPSVDRTT